MGAITLAGASPKGESQSNGVAERAVQDIEDGLRTHKLDLEGELKEQVPISHTILIWLVEHVVDILIKFKVGHDGRTAYERLKGKQYKGEVLEFASSVLHRVPDKARGGLMMERWLPGVWLGKRFTTDEHVVGLGSMVCVCVCLCGGT